MAIIIRSILKDRNKKWSIYRMPGAKEGLRNALYCPAFIPFLLPKMICVLRHELGSPVLRIKYHQSGSRFHDF